MGKRSLGLSHRMRDCQVRAGQSVPKSRMSVQGAGAAGMGWWEGVGGGGRGIMGEKTAPTVDWKMWQ